jgi:hypothetical protein
METKHCNKRRLLYRGSQRRVVWKKFSEDSEEIFTLPKKPDILEDIILLSRSSEPKI